MTTSVKFRFAVPVAVYLILRQGNAVLLSLRQGTGYADGQYSMVAGHVEDGESASAAMIREAAEEAGIIVRPEDLDFACALHRNDPDHKYMDIYFFCNRWTGEIMNMEPAKCGDLRFFDVTALPDNMVECVRHGLVTALSGQHYTEFGWKS